MISDCAEHEAREEQHELLAGADRRPRATMSRNASFE
jgi:hypothetical protein